jgi:hypothetical protein
MIFDENMLGVVHGPIYVGETLLLYAAEEMWDKPTQFCDKAGMTFWDYVARPVKTDCREHALISCLI